MEKRKDKRFEAHGTIDSYNFHAQNRAVTINAPVEISLRDLSYGGIGIKTNVPLEVEDTLSIHLQLDNHNYVVIGKVVWCKESGNLYDCGLKLIYMPEELISRFSGEASSESKYSN